MVKQKNIPIVTYEEFQERAKSNPNLLAKSPFIVEGYIQNWPCYEEWRNLDYLRKKFGKLSAYACSPQFTTNSNVKLTRVKTRFDQYLDYLKNPEKIEEIYEGLWCDGSYETFLAQNKPLYCGSLRIIQEANDRIFDDLNPIVPKPLENWNSILPFYYKICNHFWLYVSLPGALTPLHQDNNGTFAYLAQLDGRKRVTLYSPEDFDFYHNSKVGFLDVLNPNDEEFPKWRSATKWTGELTQGQALMMGTDWAHHVVTIEQAISVSLDFVNQNNISAYAASEQWANSFGRRVKMKPEALGLFSSEELKKKSDVYIGRKAMRSILKNGLKNNNNGFDGSIRKVFLSELESLSE